MSIQYLNKITISKLLHLATKIVLLMCHRLTGALELAIINNNKSLVEKNVSQSEINVGSKKNQI